MVVSAIPLVAGGLLEGVKVLYRTGADVNGYMNSHIKDMKASETPSVARTGAVLEAAKAGFGFGYAAPVVVVAAGQLMLGNPISAITAAAGMAFPNPIVMTCAAVGAVYWGWGALSKKEQDQLLKTLSEGLEIGIEFIRSVVRFVVGKTKELIGAENLEGLMTQVTSAREQIKTLLQSFAESVGEQAGSAVDATSNAFNVAADATAAYWKKLKAAILKSENASLNTQIGATEPMKQ